MDDTCVRVVNRDRRSAWIGVPDALRRSNPQHSHFAPPPSRHQRKMNALHAAAEAGRANVVAALLSLGAKVDAPTVSGPTAPACRRASVVTFCRCCWREAPAS